MHWPHELSSVSYLSSRTQSSASVFGQGDNLRSQMTNTDGGKNGGCLNCVCFIYKRRNWGRWHVSLDESGVLLCVACLLASHTSAITLLFMCVRFTSVSNIHSEPSSTALAVPGVNSEREARLAVGVRSSAQPSPASSSVVVNNTQSKQLTGFDAGILLHFSHRRGESVIALSVCVCV